MDVVVQAAAAVVDATNFITSSEASLQAKKTAGLLKTLNVNAVISGPHGIGKKTLASYILPNAAIYDASNFDELLVALESSHEIIIRNINKSPNIPRLVEALKKNNVRVIATSTSYQLSQEIEELCSIRVELPPLQERLEDVETLIEVFLEEAHQLFGGEKNRDAFKSMRPDLSQNGHSLRRQVMINYLLQDINDRDIMELLEKYLYGKLGSKDDYKKFLYLYEAPLIKSGLKKFKSQLQLADKLGLNRNTLRKKIAQNKQYL
jgi:DNA-binding NtrC family response regulator